MNATSEQAITEIGKSWRTGPNVFLFGVLALFVVVGSEYSQFLNQRSINAFIDSDIQQLKIDLAKERDENRAFRRDVLAALVDNQNTRKDVADTFYDLQSTRHAVTTGRLERMEAALNRIEGSLFGSNGSEYDP